MERAAGMAALRRSCSLAREDFRSAIRWMGTMPFMGKPQPMRTSRLTWVLRDLTVPNSVRDISPDIRFSFSNTAFMPDSKALVYGIQQGGGEAILVQPLDGSPSHVLVDFVPSRIRDFAWSPSGDQLAVLREHSTSDVVLITDQDTKAAH